MMGGDRPEGDRRGIHILVPIGVILAPLTMGTTHIFHRVSHAMYRIFCMTSHAMPKGYCRLPW